jgi:hypothetical protein
MMQNEIKALVNASAAKFKEHNGLAKIKAIVQHSNRPATPPKNQWIDQQAPEINLPDKWKSCCTEQFPW